MKRVGRARSRSYAMSAPSWRPSRSRGATSRATRSLIARGPARTTWTCWSREWTRIASRRLCIAWASSWPGADGQGLPGVFDYYGHDARPASWSTYTRTFSSSSATTSRRATGCRSRRSFLGSARPDGEFFVPAPELELILLVVRLTLKHLTWDAMVMRRARIPASARSELADLERRSEPAEVERRLEQALPFVRRGDLRRLPAGARARCRKVRRDPRRRAPAGRSHAVRAAIPRRRRRPQVLAPRRRDRRAAGIAPGAVEAAGRGRRDHRHRRRRWRRQVDGGRGTRQAAGQDLRGGSRAPRQAPEVMDHPRPPEHRARTLRIPPGRPAPRPPGTLARDGARGSGDCPGARPLPHRPAHPPDRDERGPRVMRPLPAPPSSS